MKEIKTIPPKLATKILLWFLRRDLVEDVQGDLEEKFYLTLKTKGKLSADLNYWRQILNYARPFAIQKLQPFHSNYSAMFQSYFKIGWRNLLKGKGYSFINIAGLAGGMSIAILIGLWIYDELSFNKYNRNYDQVVQVLQHQSIGDGTSTYASLPLPLATELRNNHHDNLDHVAASVMFTQFISHGDKVFTILGCFAEPAFSEILSLEMVNGATSPKEDPSSILISESLGKTFFGLEDPLNKVIKVNNLYDLKISGVFRDLPTNSTHKEVKFIAPLSILIKNGTVNENWQSSSFEIYAHLANPGTAVDISGKIKNILFEKSGDEAKPVLFLNPMSKWHLYEFKDGSQVAGRLQFVWLFGIIGGFVLLLACINFMNLNTARSERRAKEVGIRKSMGSIRQHLILQFFSEASLVVALSFVFSILIVTMVIPWFDELSGKQINIPWTNFIFWLMSSAFVLITVLLAGSYPAIYLSSFSAVKALKGTIRSGRLASLPRQVLVVVQFTVSVSLVVGTIIVFQQVEFAKNRPVGYNRDRLLTIPFNNPEIQNNYEAFKNELLSSNSVENISVSSSSTTNISSSANNLEWEGKDPNRQMEFGTILIDPAYGDVVEWQIVAGREFSASMATDSSAFIFNESAIRQMGIKDPIGKNVRWHERDWHIIGVVRDMVMRSPFDLGKPTVFLMDPKERSFNSINIRLVASRSTNESLSTIESVFKKHCPSAPFDYKFAAVAYQLKFVAEERIGKLASVFSALAILISLLGLFGLASFVAEQRTKEIGIRKVVGASVFDLWTMLSKDFMVLVLISCCLSIPFVYYLLSDWLDNYAYHTDVSGWIFLTVACGAFVLTLATVSYQAIKAALTNPIKCLRSE